MRAGAVWLLCCVATAPLAAQTIPENPGAFPRDTFHFSSQRSVPSSVKWGMVLGGLVGAGVGAALTLNHPCAGWECMMRPLIATFGIGAGGVVGVLVGGAIGHAIANHQRLNVGLRVSLPPLH